MHEAVWDSRLLLAVMFVLLPAHSIATILRKPIWRSNWPSGERQWEHNTKVSNHIISSTEQVTFKRLNSSFARRPHWRQPCKNLMEKGFRRILDEDPNICGSTQGFQLDQWYALKESKRLHVLDSTWIVLIFRLVSALQWFLPLASLLISFWKSHHQFERSDQSSTWYYDVRRLQGKLQKQPEKLQNYQGLIKRSWLLAD